MEVNNTEEELHDVVLKIMYNNNPEKASEMSAKDILWKIDNPEISERQIKEVLAWLVRNKRVIHYLGKYELDRVEFLEQKSKSPINGDSQSKTKKKVIKPSYNIETPRTKSSKLVLSLFILAVLLLFSSLYITNSIKIIKRENNSVAEKIKNNIAKVKISNLYISKETIEVIDPVLAENLKNTFYIQNNNNSILLKELNLSYIKIDSLHNVNLLFLKQLNNEMLVTMEKQNKFISYSIISNIILLFLIVLFSIKKINPKTVG